MGQRCLLHACAPLSTEELDRRLGASHGSILLTFRHVYYAERVWTRRLIADMLPPMIEVGDQKLFCDPDPEPSLVDLQRTWPQLNENLRAWLEKADNSLLSDELVSPLPSGSSFRIKRWEIVAHAVNHSTLHRGQIISMMRALGLQPPNTDQFSYYMAR